MADEPDFDGLAGFLSTLGNSSRLRVLYQLRRPKIVADMRLSPARGRTERPVSRQAVRHHLDKLVEIEAIHRKKKGAAFEGDEYLVNHRQLFLIAEAVRDLARLKPTEVPVQTETKPVVALARPPLAGRQGLVLVHGVEEGRSWPLETGRALVIGRGGDAQVQLDYDPFVSTKHAEVAAQTDRVTLTDLGSRNGTNWNWMPLKPGQQARLAPGDVIGIGKSSLVYRA